MNPTARVRGVRLVLIVLIGAVVAPLLLLSLKSLMSASYIYLGDYLSYAAGGQRMLDGLPIYPAFQLAGPFPLAAAAWGVGFVYPPPAAMVSVPFALLGGTLGYAVFTAVSAAGLAFVAFRIARGEGLSTMAATLCAVAILLSAPSIESLATGQANTGIAALLGASWVWRRRSGYIAVLGAFVKLFPLAGLFWTFRTRSPIIRPVLLALVLFAAFVAFFGIDVWRDFARTMSNGKTSALGFFPAPRQVLDPILGEASSALAAYAAAGVLLLASVRVRSDRLAFALVSFGMIVPAPDWYMHYMLIPLVGLLPWLARLAAGWPAIWASLRATEAEPRK